MPHESAEPDDATVQDDEERPVQFRTRSRSMQAEGTIHQAPAGRQTKPLSLVAETPTQITHHHDDDDDDDKTSTTA